MVGGVSLDGKASSLLASTTYLVPEEVFKERASAAHTRIIAPTLDHCLFDLLRTPR